MRKLKLLFACLLMAVLGIGQVWADPIVLFHESFGENTTTKARAWNYDYSVKTGVATVYSGITTYTVTNVKQGKNNTGSTLSGLNQSSAGTDATIVIGPLNVASYESLAVTYQWKAASINGTYTTKLEYATSNGGAYTEVSGTGNGATSFVERSYSLPTTAQVSTLYLKITWNTSNTQGIIDEVDLQGIESGNSTPTPSVSVTPNELAFGEVEQNAVVAGKTFTLTGSNLTEDNAVSITAPEGYTVSPTSVTPSDGAISETVTVTPTTTTTGTFDGNITISSDDLEDDVTVALTMTVAAPVAVTGITLNENAISLEIGATQTLVATVEPNDATNKNISWESDDTEIATVDENGVVTAVAVGTANITCTSVADNTKTATCTVTVNAHVVSAGTYSITFCNAFFGTTGQTGSLSGANLKTHSGSQNDITVEYQKGTGSNMYLKDSEIRLYNGNKLVVTVPAGYNITAITGLKSSMTANVGTITGTAWSGKANSVTLSHANSSGTSALTTISVTYAADAQYAVTIVNPAHGTITVMNGEDAVANGDEIGDATVLNVSGVSNNAAYRFGTIRAYKTDDAETTVTISDGALTMPAYPITITADEEALLAVAVAVNDNAMGSATINGGAGPVYVDESDVIALVATANPGYEFVEWTVSDDDIILDDENDAETTAMAAVAGTITANFQAQACTGLAAPTLDEVETTYQSATIAWNEVANAEGYVLNIIKHEGNVAVVTNGLILAPEVSFEKTGLEANTQYDYSVMAVGDGSAYCDESNPLLEGNFTTDDYPTVAVTYSENGVTTNANTTAATAKKILTPFALPTTVENEISGKTFVGWTTKADFTDGDEAEATYYATGADFTIESNAAVTLYAVYATSAGGAGDTWVINTSNFAKVGSGSGYTPYNGDHTLDGITYNTSNVMLQSSKIQFKSGQGVMYNKTGFSADIVSIAIDGIDANITVYEGAEEISTGGTSVTLSEGEYPFSSGKRYFRIKMGSATGTATSITVNLAGGVTYSNYTITGSAALPVLDAPTFNLEAGSYYETKSVTLSATNDAAIYYTLDGTDPTNESSLYEEAIALSARQEYTIKAIAVKAGFETSEIASRAYNIILPYDFADFAALEKVNNKEYAVRGIISQKGTLTSGNQLPYYISANGSTEGQIKCHNGLKLNKETFTSADDVNLGDNVTVVGTWSTQYSNLNANNWMLEYTARVHSDYEIAGNLTVSDFNVGDAFDATILNDLVVNEIFTNGYKEAVDGVTFTYGDKTVWAENETSLTVTAVKNEENLKSRDFTVTVTSASLVSIALKADNNEYQTKTVYYVGDNFVAPTIVATLSDESTMEAVATYKEGFDNANTGVQNVTVSFTRGDKTEEVGYNITVKAIFDNEAAPHTVAEANAIIEAHGTSTASTEYMWVRGIVCGFKDTSIKNYYISDDGTSADQLYVYSGSYFNGTTFTAANKLQVGDVVIVKSKMQIFSNAPELSSSQVTYQLRTPEFTIADIVAGDEFEANISEDMAVVPTANSGDAEFTLTSDNTDVVTIVEGKLHAVAEGDAVITATRAATANENALNYKEATTTFNVHVIAERTRYAVTFDADGGTGDDPVIANQLAGATVDLPENPYSKANSAFAGWVVNDGAVTITDGHFTMPAAAVTIKATWNTVSTCAISFRVNGAEIATADAPQTVEYTFSQVGAAVPGFTWVGWSETEYAGETETMPTIITSYTPAAEEATKTLYGIYSRLDDSDANYGKYEKATAVAEGDYLIVCESESKIFDGSLATLDAAHNTQTASINEGVLTLANADNYVFTIATKAGGYSIKSASNKYIGQTKDENGLSSANTDTYTNSISITDGNVDITTSNNHLRYNKASNQDRFRYFLSSSYNNQTAIQLYKKNTGTTYYTSSPVEKVTITFHANGGAGGCQKAIINKGGQLTICADAPVKAHSDFTGWNTTAEGDGTAYAAGTEYTFNENVTLYAQWTGASTYAVTYAANGATGDVPTEDAQYAGDIITLASVATLTNDGYVFQGWLYNGHLYQAGASFTMPAEDVTFIAQWQQANILKYNLLTDASQLAHGLKVVLANKEAGKVAGAISGDYMSAENATFTGNQVSVTSALEFTLVAVNGGWKLQNANNYLAETAAKKVALNDEGSVWTITIANGNATLTATNALRYNSQFPRFTTYATEQQPVQLYASTIVVPADYTITEDPENTKLSDLGYVEGEAIIVSEGQQLTIDENTNAPSLTVEVGAKVTVTTTVTYETYIFKASQCGKKSNQTANPANITADNIFFDLQLEETAVSEGWYSFTVPFPVSATNGIYNAKNGQKLVHGTDYRIMTYDSQKRANGEYGWVFANGNLVPGQLYMITLGDTEYTDLRFRKLEGASHNTADTWSVTRATGSGNAEKDFGWNGIGNGTSVYRSVSGISADKYSHYDHAQNKFFADDIASMNFVMGSAFFIKATAAATLTWSATVFGGTDNYYAPAREAMATEEFLVRLGKDTKSYTDQIYVSASEDASDSYEEGHDLVKFGSIGASKTADMSVLGYGKQLCDAEFPLVNGSAEFPLVINNPEAGTYNIYIARAPKNANLYLTYEGQVVWNLSQGAYEMDLTKGETNGYGLKIVTRQDAPTAVNLLNADNEVAEKAVINGNLYILRQGKVFDATGKLMK